MLTARLNTDAIHLIQSELTTTENPKLSIDIAEEALITPAGTEIRLDLDPFQKHCLMNGLNEIDLSLEFDDAITQFESDYRKAFPWITS